MDAFDDWIARRMAREGTPGLSIVATDREKTLWAKGYGFADIAAQQRVTPETLFEFGSIGKSFTALLLLRMQERGLVDLKAPVANYLPGSRSNRPTSRLRSSICSATSRHHQRH